MCEYEAIVGTINNMNTKHQTIMIPNNNDIPISTSNFSLLSDFIDNEKKTYFPEYGIFLKDKINKDEENNYSLQFSLTIDNCGDITKRILYTLTIKYGFNFKTSEKNLNDILVYSNFYSHPKNIPLRVFGQFIKCLLKCSNYNDYHDIYENIKINYYVNKYDVLIDVGSYDISKGSIKYNF